MRVRSTWRYELLGANTVSPNWTGAPLTLQVNDSATMPQTPNGSLVLAYFNQATTNNLGTLTYTSGGSVPVALSVPALVKQPSILVQNWRANDLKLTNTSAQAATPLWIGAFGPGLPGVCNKLVIGTPMPLTTAQCAIGIASPSWMQLVMASQSGGLSIMTVVGGPQDPSGDNAYVFALNSDRDTGPGTGTPPPPGYYATTIGNSLTYEFSWASSTVYVANMSPSTALPVNVTLRSL